MGIFDFWFRKPTIEQFAAALIKQLQRKGIAGEATYDHENRRICYGSAGQPATLNLANFYKEYQRLPRLKRKKFLVGITEDLIFPKELPEDFEQAKKNLRPKIWSRAGFAMMRLHVQVDGGDPQKLDIPEYDIGSHLLASLVYDMPRAVRSISHADLDNWGTTYYEALEIARENLEQSGVMFAQIGKGFYASMIGDGFDASRMLVPSFLEKFEVDGDLIAMAPHRDLLLVCGADDDESLKIMLGLAKSGDEGTRPLVPLPVRLDGDQWVDWFPDPDRPCYSGFRELMFNYLSSEYGEQKRLLERLHGQENRDVFVASFTVVQQNESKKLTSFAVWTEGIESFLPQAELILFLSPHDEGTEAGPPASAGWETVQKLFGHLLEETEHYPARYRTLGFPSPSALAELGELKH